VDLDPFYVKLGLKVFNGCVWPYFISV